MEDQSFYNYFQKYKKIPIIIVSVIIIIIVVYFIAQLYAQGNLKDYLNKSGYKHENDTYYKTQETNKDNINTLTNYIFEIKNNKFIKNIVKTSNSNKETIILNYNNKTIEISYYNEEYTNNKIESSSQEATYNTNNKNFECHISNISGTNKTYCKKIKNEAETFSKELKQIMKDAHVKELFINKKSE